MNLSRAFCCPWERRRLRIVSLDCSSDCCEASVTFCTWNTVQPNWLLTGPETSPFSASK